jgi:hypothetical protein
MTEASLSLKAILTQASGAGSASGRFQNQKWRGIGAVFKSALTGKQVQISNATADAPGATWATRRGLTSPQSQASTARNLKDGTFSEWIRREFGQISS